jgi:hypothetical protein
MHGWKMFGIVMLGGIVGCDAAVVHVPNGPGAGAESATEGAEPGPASTTGEASTSGGGSTDSPGTTPGDSTTGDPGSTTGDPGGPGTGGTSDGGSTTTATEPQPDGALLWLFDAETGAIQDPASVHDGASAGLPGGCGDHPEAFVVSGEQPVYSGQYSLQVRFDRQWLESQPDCTAVKSLFIQNEAGALQEDTEYWHGWAVYVPDQTGDRWATARWATAGQNNKSLTVHLASDLSWQFRATQIGTSPDFELTVSPDVVNFGEPAPDEWHEFVANFMLSSDENKGFVRIWHRVRGDENWEMVVDATGRTANSSAPFPFAIRMGMHSGHSWNAPGDTKVLYYDEIRLGTSEVGFDGVAPGSGLIPAP